MASKKAHYATGVAAGVIAAGIVTDAGMGGPYYLVAILTLAASVLGSTAPDWMEIAWWRRKHKLWVTHRTWTHWGIPWAALCYFSYEALSTERWAPVAFGFAAGGLMHLLGDWPNPRGLVWIYKRHSLNLWNSGRCDIALVAAAWTAAFFFIDRTFFGGVHATWVLSIVSSRQMVI